MSLVPFVIRRALVENLRGQTIAGSSVFDSQIDPLDMVSKAQVTPFICVSIEEGIDTGFTDKNLGESSSRSRVILVDLGVGSARTIQAQGNDGTSDIVVEYAATDSGAEFTLDLLTRQLHRVFTVPPNAVWGPIFQTMVSKVSEVAMRRGLLSEDGQRAAFRQIAITVDVLAEPSHGTIHKPWLDVLSALEASTDVNVTKLASMVRSAIVGNSIRQADLGWITRGFDPFAADAVDLKTFDGVPDDNTSGPPLLTEVIVDNEPNP